MAGEEELRRQGSPSRERRTGDSGNRMRHDSSDAEAHRSSRSRGREHGDRDPSSGRPDEMRRHHGDEHRSSPSGRRHREPSARRQGDPMRHREESSHRRHHGREGAENKAHRHHHHRSAAEVHHDGLDLAKLQEPMTPEDKMAMISLQTPGMMPPSPVPNSKQNHIKQQQQQQQQQQPPKPLTKRERTAAMEEAVVEAAFRCFRPSSRGALRVHCMYPLTTTLHPIRLSLVPERPPLCASSGTLTSMARGTSTCGSSRASQSSSDKPSPARSSRSSSGGPTPGPKP